MPTTSEYFSFLAKELQARADLISEWYATHRLSSGTNKEYLIRQLLEDMLAERYNVSSGLALSSSGEFSKEADIFVIDGTNNRPLINGVPPIWLIESVYALFEVKSYLSPQDIQDSFKKCVRFKRLKRCFAKRSDQSIVDSLFIIWAYNSPELDVCLNKIFEAARGINDDELPDFIVSPSKFVVKTGSFEYLARYGMSASTYREGLAAVGEKLNRRPYYAAVSDTHCLMTFYIWLKSWLDQAGPRSSDLIGYLSDDMYYGSFRTGTFED